MKPIYSKEVSLAHNWTMFFIDLLQYEADLSVDEQQRLFIDGYKFGLLMDKVVKQGKAHSVLWRLAEPLGTEDRTWVRVYASLNGYNEYKDEVRPDNGDYQHQQHILQMFNKVEECEMTD